MADKKKNIRSDEEDGKPTKEEYAVAKFLRFNVPTKPAKLHNMEVHCFFASAAVDALMESKWSASKHAKEPLFVNRNSCVSYCQRLMDKGLFHRAERVQRKKVKEKGDKSKKKKVKDTTEKEDGGTGDELRERKSKKEKEDSEKTTALEEVKEEKKSAEKKEEKKDKKEKPLKLVMTDDHTFLDGEENIYVWIYDPANANTLFIGSLIVFGVAAVCLFPLWPPCVHTGVYYTSLTAAGFVGFILFLVVLRNILFCVIWLLTLGRHHFWLLPNLTEDVGLRESFQPLYKHDLVLKETSATGKAKSKSGKKPKKKAKKKDRSSDKEDSGSEPEFEMIDRGDVEEDELGERMEREEESEENEEAKEEEEEYGVEEEEEEEEEEDYEEDGEDQNNHLEDEYEEQEDDEEEEEEEEEEEKGSELKKDK